MDRYAAKGVFVGVDHTREEWERIIDSIQERDSYLVQQFIEPPTLPCISFRNEKPFLEDYKYITGLFVYNGRFHGLYTRAGTSNVIASVTGCRIMPNLYARPKLIGGFARWTQRVLKFSLQCRNRRGNIGDQRI